MSRDSKKLLMAGGARNLESGDMSHAHKAGLLADTPPEGEAFDLDAIDPAQLLKLVNKAGGQRAFARKHNLKRTTLQNKLYKLRKDPFTHRPAPEPIKIGDQPGVKRFILTSAQDCTVVHEAFLANLEAYRDWLGESAPCEIMIAGFTYNKKLFEDHAKNKTFYHDRILPYLVKDRIRIADKIDFCGEMNTLPTAEKPLSGFHTYTRNRWGIFPHAKVQLISVPTMKHTPAKQIMTTGAVTKPNYVPKRAGIKASFHHIYGAVLVEFDADGNFFCRHLIADDETGSFYDLDRHIADGGVTIGHAVTALTPGDIHVAQVDPEVCLSTFGIAPTDQRGADPKAGRTWRSIPREETMIGVLRPGHVFIHDVSDFRARNHHEIKDPHTRFRHHVEGVESVEFELREVAHFLTVNQQRFQETAFVVVESNHDQALLRWLKTADYRDDPINAEFFLDCQRRSYAALRTGDKDFSIFEWVMRSYYEPWRCDGIRFLREDESYVVGQVEHSNHGHRGPNGSRGSVVGLQKIGPKITMGHVHSCQILDGVYATGTTSLMDMSYNLGPSSWSHTHCVQYANGKRALITLQNGRWRV